MPNIREYTNKIDGLETNPLSRAANAYSDLARTKAYAGQAIGRSIGSGIAEVGEGVQAYADKIDLHNTTSEVTAGQATLFSKLSSFNQQYNEAVNTSDPNVAPQVVEGLVTKFGEELDKEDENYTTPKAQEWWRQRKAELKQHYFEKGTADISMKAGQAVVQNLNSAAHDASLTASQDISMLDFVRDSYKATVTTATGHLDPDQAGQIQAHVDDTLKTITRDAVVGAILQNPTEMGARITSGAYDKYFDAGDKQDLMKVVSQVEDNHKNDAVAAQERQIKENKRQVNQALVQLQTSTIDPNTGQTVLPPDYFQRLTMIAALPDADVDGIRAMQNAGKQINRDSIAGVDRQSDPTTFENFRSRLSIAAGAPGALTREEVAQARADGRLSNTDYSFYTGAVGNEKADPVRKEQEKALDLFFAGNKRFITASNPGMMKGDAAGDRKFLEFQQDKMAQYWAGISAGKTKEQLLSPRSPDYIGNDIARYQVTFKQTMDDMKTGLKEGRRATPDATGREAPPAATPGAVPVQNNTTAYKPGESMEEYANRLRGK